VIADIREQKGLLCKTTDFKFETLPVHLTMNFKVVDEHGRQLEMGRNLANLRAEFGGRRVKASRKLRVQKSWRCWKAGNVQRSHQRKSSRATVPQASARPQGKGGAAPVALSRKISLAGLSTACRNCWKYSRASKP
jgi:hypothetical protein